MKVSFVGWGFFYKGALRLAWLCLGLLLAVGLLLASGTMVAEESNEKRGAPNATATIDGRYLPAAPPTFGGGIDFNADRSKPFWPPQVVPPQGAPNILLIMTDDVGFGAQSTFGGVIPTPNLDRIAREGLRYTQFHSTALCSPTRAALITSETAS